MKKIIILFATLLVVIGGLAYAGVITGNINLDLTGNLFVGNTEESDGDIPAVSVNPYVMLSDETTSQASSLRYQDPYYYNPDSIQIPPPETMPIPSPEIFQWSPSFVYILSSGYVEYEQEVAPNDQPYAIPNPNPPESIPWSPPFIRLPPIIICNPMQDTLSK